MENQTLLATDRVRQHTSDTAQAKIDHKTEENIRHYTTNDKQAIRLRIQELNKEWDIERALELASATNALLGLGLGLTVNKRWLALTGITAAFLAQHALQGWCPPLPVMRALGVRTGREIDAELQALQAKL